MPTTKTTTLLFLLATAGLAPAQAPAFTTGTLAELRERCRSSGSALAVDFSSDTIEPCRRLRATTWQDAGLWQWLAKNAVVARIDPEADVAAAQPLALTAYPTIVVFGADGAELDRIVGYVDAASLQEKLSRKIHKFPTDFRERESIGDKLRKQGDLDGALEHYLWLWDHGEEYNPSMSGVRVSFFLSKLAGFASKHPPARLALEQRRDALLAVVLEKGLEYEPVSDLVHLAKALRTPEVLLTVVDKLPAASWDTQGVGKREMVEALIPPLVAAKRHADAVRIVGDPLASLEDSIGILKDGVLPEAMRRQMLARALAGQVPVLVALFSVRDERTTALVERMFELDGGVKTWLLVLKAAKRADNDLACHDYAVRALQELPEKDHDAVREFLQRK